jgi:hypothetical protein
LATLVWLVAALFPAMAADHWGEMLPEQPSQFIFGYGSLINTVSRNATASRPVHAIPVRVSAGFGYVRAWVAQSRSGFTALGMRHPAAGEVPSTINGVIYPVGEADLPNFDKRENAYMRISIPLDKVEPVSWQRLPVNAQIWVYVPIEAEGRQGTHHEAPSPRFPLLQSYIDLVVDGALEYGESFARELIETTVDWNQFWLNDRELARRPWVYDKNHSQVDELLAKTEPAASQFKYRSFPEEFGKYFARAGQ